MTSKQLKRGNEIQSEIEYLKACKQQSDNWKISYSCCATTETDNKQYEFTSDELTKSRNSFKASLDIQINTLLVEFQTL